ncbi:MAG: PD40 domain-containing protein [Bacteroidales bacterium]|nr:PD40 domain-containing protein [Bacteroidales bacterium]
MKGITTFRNILYTAVFVLTAGTLHAQTERIDSLLLRGDSLRMEYRFEESLEAYSEAMEAAQDSVFMLTDSLKRIEVSDRILLSENGRNMAGYAYKPVVVARHRFHIDDFFLYYPLPDKSWRETPNQLDTMAAGRFSKALYAPEPSWEIYYSAQDADGIRNIYMTELQDTIWTYPSLLNENITSASNEIYPMLSPDGKSLYFASEGLYGMGGYDLYVSHWDYENEEWGEPVNLGFPYSSPADDMLLVHSADGEHTIFASNRDCPSDSVWVYVLEFDSMPVRHAVEEPEELRRLAALDPAGTNERMDGNAAVNTDIPENVDIRRYMEKMTEVRSLRDSISRYGAQLDSDRNRFAMSEDDQERTRITQEILKREAMLPKLQDSLERASAQLQKIEMEFLFSGVVIDPDKVLAAADKEIVGEATSYTFTKMSMGGKLDLKIMDPPVVFDYTFKILPEGQFALDNTIPGGIVYQIQIFGGGGKATVKSLKGLSPVFERISANGRYVYRVGLFNSYKDVLANLNSVKRVGFRNAFIVAYIDGEEVPVSKARTLEAEKTKSQMYYEVRLAPADGEIDATVAEGIRQQAEGKDIAKIETEDGVVYYIVGPFSDKAKADALAEFIKAMGIGEVTCDLAGMEKEQEL